MSRLQFRSIWQSLAVAAAAVAALLPQLNQLASAASDASEGEVVTISPDGNASGGPTVVGEQTKAEEIAAPAYWLGIQGGPIDSPLLRTHLQLADDLGVAVVDVVPDSPAAKAGLQKHDVLVAVNGEALHHMAELQQAVSASNGKPIEIKLFRLAKEETIAVTPEERPADFTARFPQQGGMMQIPGMPGGLNLQIPGGDVEELMKQLQAQGGNNFRAFGPGIGGMQMNSAVLPGGVSVAITREGDGPAKITVKRGDESWEILGDDQEALAKLPEDVRPFVEQMLAGQHAGPGINLRQFQFPGAGGLPEGIDQFGAEAQEQIDGVNQDLQQRLDEMQRQLHELEQQLHNEQPTADPST